MSQEDHQVPTLTNSDNNTLDTLGRHTKLGGLLRVSLETSMQPYNDDQKKSHSDYSQLWETASSMKLPFDCIREPHS